jgi:hypothetical protein
MPGGRTEQVEEALGEQLGEEQMRLLRNANLRGSVTYQEGTDLRMLCSVLKWGAGIASLLAVAGICGLIVMYGDIQSLKGQIADLKTSVDRVYRIVEPRFRGGNQGDTDAG